MSTAMPKWQQILSAATGIAFLITLLAIALFVPKPTEFQVLVFRTVLALAAGAFATIISGFIHVEAKWQQLTIRAGAGLAVFVLIFFVNPPKLIQQLSESTGFVPPSTSRSGDGSVAIATVSDGNVISILADRLLVDLQGEKSALEGTVTTSLTLNILKYRQNPAESVVNHLRGAVFLSKDAAATITINVGGRTKQFDFPFGEKAEMQRTNDLYELSDFFRQITTPIDWNSQNAESLKYPITLSIFGQRKSKSDTVLVAIDSLDAKVNYEGRESR